jgi:uncharacterized protein YpmB
MKKEMNPVVAVIIIAVIVLVVVGIGYVFVNRKQPASKISTQGAQFPGAKVIIGH